MMKSVKIRFTNRLTFVTFVLSNVHHSALHVLMAYALHAKVATNLTKQRTNA